MKPIIHRATARPRSREADGPSLTLVYAEPEPIDAAVNGVLSLAYDETAPDTLNLVERLAAHVGEWVGALSEFWVPSCGPFFAADGQIAACSAAFALEPTGDAPPPAL